MPSAAAHDIKQVALAFDRACRAAGVRYALMGGIAVAVWGNIRTTRDVDAIVELPREKVSALTEALSAEGLDAAPRDFQDALLDRTHVTVFHESGFHVDVKLARTARELDEIARAREEPVTGGLLRLVPPEETVAFKLKFGTPRDVEDARGILVRQAGSLDLKRLWALAAELGVGSALNALLKEIGEHSPPEAEDD